MESWARELSEQVIGGSPFHIGQIVDTDDNRQVKIVDGQYWGRHGLSNFWYWKEILPDGTLDNKLWCGYGYIDDEGRLDTEEAQLADEEI